MNRNIIVSILALSCVGLFSAAIPLRAKNLASNADLPDIDGIYNVPNRPNLKLRVFVHHAKPFDSGKPLKSPAPPAEKCVSSSVTDLNSSEFVAKAGWKLPASWEYRLNPASVPASVGANKISAIAANAFLTWAEAVPGAVNILKGPDVSIAKAQLDGLNIIAWGRAPVSALAVTYTWYDTTTGFAREIDTIFNARFSWRWSNPALWPSGQMCAFGGSYDAQDILTHELGHTMGLNDMYDAVYANHTMYGYGAMQETKKDTLADGDKLGVASIY
jgi:hypothetical protein